MFTIKKPWFSDKIYLVSPHFAFRVVALQLPKYAGIITAYGSLLHVNQFTTYGS